MVSILDDWPVEPAKPTGSIARRELLRNIWRLFRPYRLRVLAVIVTVLLSAGLGTLNPLLIKVVFDRALFCGSGCPNLPLLDELVAIMIAVPIITGVIGVFQTFLTNRVGQRVMEDLRNTLYLHLQGMSLRFFTGTRTGEIQSRLSNDIGGIQTVVTDTASSILSNVVILVSSLIAMTVISWQLTVMSLALVPLFVLLTYRAGNARRRITTETQKAYAEMTAITEETLSVSGILLSKVFGRKREEVQRFRGESRRLADLAVRREMIGRSLFAVVGTFFSSAPALVYLVAGYIIVGGHANLLSPGTIVAFTALQSRLFFPVGQLLQVSVEVQGSLALFERIFEYLRMPHDIVDHPAAVVVDPQTARGEVEFDHVYFRYDAAASGPLSEPVPGGGDGTARAWALEDITFEVKPGQLAAIVGPSGAGKTTISYLTPRLYDVSAGAVRIDGVDVRTMEVDSITSLVSMVTQETYLFHASVRHNLQYAKPDATDEELEAAARSAFIHNRIMQLDDGYDTLVGERGYRMSGGEKQRLAIARVILKAPRILILDEATSALDTTSERLVQAALRPLMKGRTTIAIAHRLSTILAADVIFVVDSGRIVERGTHGDLLRGSGQYAHLYEQQFQSGRVEAQCEDGLVLSSGEVIGAVS
jgi:ATP-binding cassette subfamily B protein